MVPQTSPVFCRSHLRFWLPVIFVLAPTLASAQGPPPPPPLAPPPPSFMTMKGYPLACFNKPWMESGGFEIFVCNGFAGVAGARKKSDRSQTVFVRDADVARNLNLQAARAECTGGKVSVTMDVSGVYDLRCSTRELRTKTRFQPASRSDWAKFEAAFR